MKLGRDEAWPPHPKPWWKETLERAREHGWAFSKFSAHSFGKIECETGDCSIVIFTSGAAGETVAKNTLKEIERCVHGHRKQSLISRIATTLRQARRMVTAAEIMIDKDQRTNAMELLDEGDKMTASAWEEIGDLMNEIDTLDAEIHAELAASGLSTTNTSAVLETASGHVRQARDDLKMAPPRADQVKVLNGEVKALLVKIAALRSRMAG